MNPRNRLYIMAFAAYTSALLVAAVFARAALQYSTAGGVAQLTVALSGNGIGGFALLLGIFRDDRAQKAEASAKESEQKAANARQEAEQFRKEAEQQRQRAERAEAELESLKTGLSARVFRLETAAGLATPDASEDSTEN